MMNDLPLAAQTIEFFMPSTLAVSVTVARSTKPAFPGVVWLPGSTRCLLVSCRVGG